MGHPAVCGFTRLLIPTKPKGIKTPQTGELPGIARSPGESCTSLEGSGYGDTHARTEPHSSPPCFSLPLPVAGRRMRQQPCLSSNQPAGNHDPGTNDPGTNSLYGYLHPKGFARPVRPWTEAG